MLAGDHPKQYALTACLMCSLKLSSDACMWAACVVPLTKYSQFHSNTPAKYSFTVLQLSFLHIHNNVNKLVTLRHSFMCNDARF